MLPKKRKVTKNLFPLLAKHGRSISVDLFSLRTAPYGGSTRFSVVVSKKVGGNAVCRNRARRHLYAILHSLLPRVRVGALCAFHLKENINHTPPSALRLEVERILEKAALLKALDK